MHKDVATELDGATAIEHTKVIVVIGADVRQQQPMLNHRVRKAQNLRRNYLL